ncbi:hypothetical protein SEA_SKOG_103 [Gordonia phage Skog]|uniref:Uncharacterized protein n=1 Tax=Gordonia phage Skog TaxID=2704033 RepID=A0A6G6XK78_9CAUD|nr:hypothetical protein KHQ85_gp103 [Gordonia phage Skog]QIG58255.1 hypothetical protein SEA_SKOG_103 [Gordonia phage Skog]
MAPEITIAHDGVPYRAKVMKITSTHLGYEDHGIFTAWLQCQGDGTGIGIGGVSLDTPVQVDHGTHGYTQRVGTALGMEWIIQIMATVGVRTWEELVGQRIYVLFSAPGLGQMAAGIANIDSGKALITEKFFAEQRKTQEV